MKTSSKKWLFSALILVCVCVFVGVIFKMAYDLNTDRTEQKWYKDTAPKITYDENDDNTDNGINELIEQNPDCVAWVRIEKTKIDYPIMQTKDNPEYYLRRNFNKEYSYIGTPFLDASCDLQTSQNLIVYGHNMRDGTMFAELLKYRQKQFGVDNPIIQLITPNGCRRYVVIAVARVRNDDAWYSFTDTADEILFNELKKHIESKSLYTINGSMEYGDSFLTLSTCEYSQSNGRLILIAKRSEGSC